MLCNAKTADTSWCQWYQNDAATQIAEPEWAHPHSKVIYMERHDMLGETEKVTARKKSSFWKLFSSLFFFFCLLFSQAWFKLFCFNTLEFFIFFVPHSITTLSAELVRAWKAEHSQHCLKDFLWNFYVASGFCSIFFFFSFCEERKIKQ